MTRIREKQGHGLMFLNLMSKEVSRKHSVEKDSVTRSIIVPLERGLLCYTQRNQVCLVETTAYHEQN